MKLLSLILCLISLALMITASLIKGEKIGKTLVLVCAANVLMMAGYMIESGMGGAGASVIGVLISVINYFFESKGKPIPMWLNIIYTLAFVAVAAITGGITIPAVLVMIAGTACVLALAQKNGKGYRVWISVNSIVWIVYDIIMHTWGPLVKHSSLLVFTLAGMLIHDRKNKGEKNLCK